MKPAFNRLSRRQFLIGAGGASLALPLLPSLLPRNAEAQAMAAMSSERYFAHMTTWHGVFQSQYFGTLLNAQPTQTQTYAGVAIRSAPLTATASGSMMVISDILQAQASNLTPRMLGLMNVINGLDFGTGVGHNRGGTLGGNSANPTIDQVLAASKNFYPTQPLAPAIVRNLVSLSSTSSGIAQTQQTADSNVALFDALFKTTTTTSSSPVLVDSVKAHADLVMADPRCSADCKQRLSDYLSMMYEVQSKVQMTVSSSFQRPTTDTSALEASAGFYANPPTQAQAEKLWNDIVVAAFTAGISRIYVSGPNTYTFGVESEFPWHSDYAHSLSDPVKRAGFSAAVQLQFESAMLDLATKMDSVTTADGRTLLDKGLVASGMELGSGGDPGTHMNRCIPITTFGNAGGYFNTGLSLDYRDLTSFSWSSNPHWYSGLLYPQWMGMVLRAMGLPTSDYSTNNGAYGYPSVKGPNDHSDAIWAAAANDLPWLKA
jgi:hypothetical protein